MRSRDEDVSLGTGRMRINGDIFCCDTPIAGRRFPVKIQARPLDVGPDVKHPFLEGAVAVDPVRQDTEMVHEECGPLSARDVLPIDVGAGFIEAPISFGEKNRKCISVHLALEKSDIRVGTSSYGKYNKGSHVMWMVSLLSIY